MEILIHRYLLEGKDKQKENTLSQLKAASKAGKFFETDIRRLPTGEFYISHDPQTTLTPENDAREHLKFWKSENCKIALNIKELGYEADLVKFLQEQGVIENIFLFDFDILLPGMGAEPQSYIDNIHKFEPKLECAMRVSDRQEPIDRALAIQGTKIIWLDEFDSLWVTEADIKKLKAAGRIVYCIAPDLHNFPMEQTTQRFKDFIAWGADGICTDYPLLLKEILAK